MAYCPACEADLDIDSEQLEEGGVVNCADCGAHFEVVNPNPLELERVDEDDDDDEEDDDFEEEEDEDDEEEEEEGYDDESDLEEAEDE